MFRGCVPSGGEQKANSLLANRKLTARVAPPCSSRVHRSDGRGRKPTCPQRLWDCPRGDTPGRAAVRGVPRGASSPGDPRPHRLPLQLHTHRPGQVFCLVCHPDKPTPRTFTEFPSPIILPGRPPRKRMTAFPSVQLVQQNLTMMNAVCRPPG